MFYDHLRAICKEKDTTVTAVIRELGLSSGNLTNWKNGRLPKTDIAIKLANHLGVSVEQLLGEDDFTRPEVTEDVVQFPVLGDIAAGFERVAVADWEGEKVDVPRSYLHGRPVEDYIVLKVCGDSMYPFYLDGDVVLVLRTPTLEHSGQVGLVRYDGENATLKRVEYVEGEDWLRLVPLNPMHQPRTIEGADLELCSVIGIPKLLLRSIPD